MNAVGPSLNLGSFLYVLQVEAAMEMRIKNIVFNHLLKPNQTVEEQQKIRTFVQLTPLSELPIVPPEHILPAHTIEHFKEIRQTWCLYDKCALYQLWAVDIFKNLEELIPIASRIKSYEGLQKIKTDFAAIVLLYAVIFEQKCFRAKFSSPQQSMIYWMKRFIHNLEKIIHLREELSNLRSNEFSVIQERRQKQKNKGKKETRNVTKEKYEYIIRALDLGIEMWKNSYYQQYFFRCPPNAISPKQAISCNPSLDIKQVNTFIEMIRTAWIEVNKRSWVTTVHLSVLSIPPSPNENNVNMQTAGDYRKHIQKLSLEIYDYHWKIMCLGFQISTGTVTWEKCQRELGLNFDKTTLCMSPVDWVTDSTGCCNLAVREITTVLDLFEAVVCKPLLPQFYSFEDLVVRLMENHEKVFRNKAPQNTESLHLKPFEEGGLDKLINRFFLDLTKVHMEFDKQIRQHLPPQEYSQGLMAILPVLKGLIRFLPAPLTETFYPYRNAVIFAATRVLPAFEKGQRAIMKSFENTIKNVDPLILGEKKEELINILKGLCLFRFKPYLDLFILLRDIHVILLAPLESSLAWEKGLHLLPEELDRFFQLPDCEKLIETHIEKKAETPSEGAVDVLSFLNEPKEAELPPSREIPPLKIDDRHTSLETLTVLKDLDKFKILPGEKTRVIFARLKKMGVYVLRSATGSHRILAHPNTVKTFSIPDHDELSRGVSKDLEDWVNQEILVIT